MRRLGDRDRGAVWWPATWCIASPHRGAAHECDDATGLSTMITIDNFTRGARGLRVVWQCEEMGLPYRLERMEYPVASQ